MVEQIPAQHQATGISCFDIKSYLYAMNERTQQKQQLNSGFTLPTCTTLASALEAVGGTMAAKTCANYVPDSREHMQACLAPAFANIPRLPSCDELRNIYRKQVMSVYLEPANVMVDMQKPVPESYLMPSCPDIEQAATAALDSHKTTLANTSPIAQPPQDQSTTQAANISANRQESINPTRNDRNTGYQSTYPQTSVTEMGTTSQDEDNIDTEEVSDETLKQAAKDKMELKKQELKEKLKNKLDKLF
jgi:hypothetical protein